MSKHPTSKTTTSWHKNNAIKNEESIDSFLSLNQFDINSPTRKHLKDNIITQSQSFKNDIHDHDDIHLNNMLIKREDSINNEIHDHDDIHLNNILIKREDSSNITISNDAYPLSIKSNDFFNTSSNTITVNDIKFDANSPTKEIFSPLRKRLKDYVTTPFQYSTTTTTNDINVGINSSTKELFSPLRKTLKDKFILPYKSSVNKTDNVSTDGIIRFSNSSFGYTSFGLFCMLCRVPVGHLPVTSDSITNHLDKKKNVKHDLDSIDKNFLHTINDEIAKIKQPHHTFIKERNIQLWKCSNCHYHSIRKHNTTRHMNHCKDSTVTQEIFCKSICDRFILESMISFPKLQNQYIVSPFNDQNVNKLLHTLDVPRLPTQTIITSKQDIMAMFNNQLCHSEDLNIYYDYLRSWYIEESHQKGTIFIDTLINYCHFLKNDLNEIEEHDLSYMIQSAETWLFELSDYFIHQLSGDIRSKIQSFEAGILLEDTKYKTCFNNRLRKDVVWRYLKKMLCMFWRSTTNRYVIFFNFKYYYIEIISYLLTN